MHSNIPNYNAQSASSTALTPALNGGKSTYKWLSEAHPEPRGRACGTRGADLFKRIIGALAFLHRGTAPRWPPRQVVDLLHLYEEEECNSVTKEG